MSYDTLVVGLGVKTKWSQLAQAAAAAYNEVEAHPSWVVSLGDTSRGDLPRLRVRAHGIDGRPVGCWEHADPMPAWANTAAQIIDQMAGRQMSNEGAT